MSNNSLRRFIFQGPSAEDEMLLRFPEPPETISDDLFARLVDGRYDKPFMVEDREFRAMCFALDGCTQSEMRLDDPTALVSAYTRKMMGFLLFRRRVRRLLMIGLGGGSLVKYCYRHLTTTRITAIEIDSEVIALRTHFHVPPDDSRLRVINDDGARYVSRMVETNQKTDVILVDAYDRRGIAAAVVEYGFLQDASRVLSPGGVFVMNIAENLEVGHRHIETIRSVFGEPVIQIAMADTENIVVFAGNALRDRRRLMMMSRNSERVQGHLGLHFPTLLRRSSDYHRQSSFRNDRRKGRQ